MNILFCYKYRDGANNKQYNEIIFANPQNTELKEIELLIRQKLIDGLWFVVDDWKIPNQFIKNYMWGNEIDHNWHEFDGVEETKDETTERNTIEDLVSLIKLTKLPWYQNIFRLQSVKGVG
jgi:hypothetical protein